MNLDEFPDRVHIEALREALWRPKSRAAVMVGAGVSRNADKLSPAVRDFPLWWEIAAELQKALGPRASGHDATRLGQMYENTYGRARLDDLLLELIPDGKYEPGPLHQRLMQLPWADVFTTNYDTLLERTRGKVPEQKYDVVETPQDLTRAEQPRIVKLHGSFPARRPFLFTAEDYRRYPVDVAPFVNLVRQSAMENALCLVGFSGDDPNFLQWAGWVRDQLGSTAPKMYLCGALDLTTPERSYYQHMQVIPIDLGPLFPKRDWAPAERHRAALAWLLESLHAGEPVDRGKWPGIESPERTRPLPAPSPPPLPPVKAPERLTEPKRPSSELDEATLKALLSSWRSERASYPGWAVCPEHARRSLSYRTPGWFWHFKQPASVQLLERLALPARADALHEIVWRAEVCLFPLPNTLPPLIERVLESMNPRPRMIGLRDATLTPDTATEPLDWDHLAEVWVALAFALVRHAWQFQDAGLHERWIGRLQDVATVRSSWRARFWHAKCWHHLVRLETKEALLAARDWPPDPSLPFWEAKRAAVLGELGQLDEARAITGQALERVRLGRDRAWVDYQSLSEEGWIHLLHSTLELRAWEPPVGPDYEQRERRLRELARDHCNPGDDLRHREESAQEEEPGVRQRTTRGFDPGIVHQSTGWRRSNGSEWALVCTLHDGTALIQKTDGFLAALRRVWRASPRLALGLVIRAGASDALEEGKSLAGLVSRGAIACIPQADVDGLHEWLSSVLRNALLEREQHPDYDTMLDDHRGDRHRIKGAAEVLSRMAFRSSDKQLSELFELACSMDASTVCQNEIDLYGAVERLLRRTVYTAPPERLRSWLPRLLSLSGNWPEIFGGGLLQQLPRPTPADNEACFKAINHLLALVRGDDAEARHRAFVRLADLAFVGMLLPDQLQSLVGALWMITNEQEQGYPAGIHDLLPRVLLKLPERQPGEPRRVIARYLRDGEFEAAKWIAFIESVTALVAERFSDEPSISGIVWTPEEARGLLAKLASFWQAENVSEAHQQNGRSPFVSKICLALSVTIAPFLDPGNTVSRDLVRRLVDSMRSSGRTTCAWPALLLLEAAEPAEAAIDLHRALLGARRDDVRDGAFTLPVWMDLGQKGRVQPPPVWLVDVLVAAAETGRQPGLTYVLDALTSLLQRKQPALEQRHMEALTRAVDRLREVTSLDGMRDDGTWNDDLSLDADERMAVLAEASALAAALAAVYRRRATAEPAEITTWRTFAAAQPLPEVRRPWQSETRSAPNEAKIDDLTVSSSGNPPTPSGSSTP